MPSATAAATMISVAQRARVSVATVSRALTNIGSVKESTRRRVIRAAEDLNYHPNLHARSLAGGRASSLGIVVSNICNPFFTGIFMAMEAEARARGLQLLLEHTDYKPSQLVESVRSMIGQRVGGIALIVSEMDEAVVQVIADSGLPAVFYDIGVPAPKTTNIRVRYEVGMQRIVQYLHSLGHRRMAFLGHHPGLAPLESRTRAFIAMMEYYDGQVEFTTVMAKNDDLTAGARAAHELCSSGFEPTALICVNDYLAIGAVRALVARGICVPGDVSVTGFDNIEFSEYSNPALTTADIPRALIGRLVVEALLEGGSAEGNEISIEPQLVVRESTTVAQTR